MTSTPAHTTSVGRAHRAPAKAGGGLKYLVTAATVAAVVGGWGLIAAPLVEQASSNVAAVIPAAGAAGVASGPTLIVAPANGAQAAAPAQAPATTSLRSVTPLMNQPVVRTRSSR